MNTACDYIDAPEFDDYGAAYEALARVIRVSEDHPRNWQRSYHSAPVAHEEITT